MASTVVPPPHGTPPPATLAGTSPSGLPTQDEIHYLLQVSLQGCLTVLKGFQLRDLGICLYHVRFLITKSIENYIYLLEYFHAFSHYKIEMQECRIDLFMYIMVLMRYSMVLMRYSMVLMCHSMVLIRHSMVLKTIEGRTKHHTGPQYDASTHLSS